MGDVSERKVLCRAYSIGSSAGAIGFPTLSISFCSSPRRSGAFLDRSRFGTFGYASSDGKPIVAVNLLDRQGIQNIITKAVSNFTGFAPLGTVLVAMIGVGVAERSGLFSAALKGFVRSVPHWLITAALVFAGVNASLTVDAGYVILVPLGAVLFAQVGRHPIAGLAAAFAGVSGGFSANLFHSGGSASGRADARGRPALRSQVWFPRPPTTIS